MFRQFGAQELIIILLIVVLLFGAKKLPETARGLGRSLRIFKAETRDLNADEDASPEADAPQQQLTAERSTEPAAPAAPATPATPAADPTVTPSTSSTDERS